MSYGLLFWGVVNEQMGPNSGLDLSKYSLIEEVERDWSHAVGGLILPCYTNTSRELLSNLMRRNY